MINIHDFCAKEDDPRFVLHHTIPYQGWLYATNGHIAVRVRPVEALPDTDDKIGLIIAKQFTIYHPTHTMEPLPVYATVVLTDCRRCNGTRILKEKDECKECRGEGFVEWDSGKHTYEATCKECQGDGEINAGGSADRTCNLCTGSGKNMDVPVNFGATAINYRYLSMMERLPNLLVRLSGKEYPDPIPFSFDDGQGIVMPIKPST